MSKSTFRASVTYQARLSEVREFTLPSVPTDAGILRVEAAGVCGSDISAHSETTNERILGHENVGVIEEIGEAAAQRWGVANGDRVVLEEYLPCGHCDLCRTTQFRFCKETDSRGGGIRYGATGIDVKPGLWGGYAQYMYLHPRSILHYAPEGTSSEALTLSLPIGNGYEWACIEGQTGPGKTVVVFGPGQQGLACVYAAKQAGAKNVILFGLASDSNRLTTAKLLGADIAVDVTSVDPMSLIREVTLGEMADLVIDTARGDSQTISISIDILKQCGILLLATADDRINHLPIGTAQWKCLSIRGVRGHSYGAVEWAIGQISSDIRTLGNMCTDTFDLQHVDEAILATAGMSEHKSIHATVLPWG